MSYVLAIRSWEFLNDGFQTNYLIFAVHTMEPISRHSLDPGSCTHRAFLRLVTLLLASNSTSTNLLETFRSVSLQRHLTAAFELSPHFVPSA